VSRKWVVNASPLILLGKIGHLDLLRALSFELVIPSGVAREVLEGPEDDPAGLWLRGDGATQVLEADPMDPLVAAWDLGVGESQVLTWAHTRAGYEAILDDGAARKCAESLNVPLRGTLSVLLLAKREGLVREARPLLEHLLEVGYRIDTAVVDTALRLTGE